MMTANIKMNKEKPEKPVLTKVEPDMSSEEIFKNLMRAFKRQGIEVKKCCTKGKKAILIDKTVSDITNQKTFPQLWN